MRGDWRSARDPLAFAGLGIVARGGGGDRAGRRRACCSIDCCGWKRRAALRWHCSAGPGWRWPRGGGLSCRCRYGSTIWIWPNWSNAGGGAWASTSLTCCNCPICSARPSSPRPAWFGRPWRDHAHELEQVDLDSLVDARRNTRQHGDVVPPAGGAGGFCNAWPDTASIWARRWLLGQNVRWPQQNYLKIDGLEDGDRLLTPRGEGLVLQLNSQPAFARVDGGWKLNGRGEPLVVETREAPDAAVPEQVSLTIGRPAAERSR